MKYLTILLTIFTFACGSSGEQQPQLEPLNIETNDYVCPDHGPLDHYIVDHYASNSDTFDIKSTGEIEMTIDGNNSKGSIDSVVDLFSPNPTMFTGTFRVHICESETIQKGMYNCYYQYNYMAPYDGSKASFVRIACNGSLGSLLWKQWDNFI